MTSPRYLSCCLSILSVCWQNCFLSEVTILPHTYMPYRWIQLWHYIVTLWLVHNFAGGSMSNWRFAILRATPWRCMVLYNRFDLVKDQFRPSWQISLLILARVENCIVDVMSNRISMWHIKQPPSLGSGPCWQVGILSGEFARVDLCPIPNWNDIRRSLISAVCLEALNALVPWRHGWIKLNPFLLILVDWACSSS